MSQVDRVQAYRLLIADVYEVAGQSRRTSEALARGLGQTAARWHVLSVVSDGPRTVSSAARRLGLARQSVQRVVDDLAAAGQVELRDNPDHVRAPLVACSVSGRNTLAELVRRGDHDRRALLERAELSAEDLATARAVLVRLVTTLRESECQT
ncbi:MAG: MarR family transcriptional regulator [Geodermatophilaceae bacterium]